MTTTSTSPDTETPPQRTSWTSRIIGVQDGVTSLRRDLLAYAAGVGLLLIGLGILQGDGKWINTAITALLFAGLAVSWNIIGGFGGQLSLGHGVYFAIGAYSVALLFANNGIPPYAGILIGIPIAVVVACLTAWPCFRLRGPFFAMATLALNQVFLVLANYFSFTGGPHGISMPFEKSALNFMFVNRTNYALLMLVYVAITVGVALYISRHKLGYSLRAVGQDPDAAAASGINVLGVKLRGIAVSAALTAVGGGLYAAYVGYVDPQSVLSLPEVGVRIALLALLGGIGTIWGPVVGAVILIPAMIELQASASQGRPGIALAAVGLLLVLVPLLLRRGIVGTLSHLVTRRKRSRAS